MSSVPEPSTTTDLNPLPGIRPPDQYNRRKGPPRVVVSSRCNVCKAGGAILNLVNRLLTTGSNYSEVHRAIQPLARSQGINISYDSIRNHQQSHLPVEDAAIQQIVQRRTQDLEADFANGTRTIVNATEYAEAMMTKAFFQLQSADVDPMAGLAAAQAFNRMIKENETESNVASLLYQLDNLLRVVKEVVPEQYWAQIVSRLNGEEVKGLTGERIIQDAEVVPEEEEAFDPPEDDDDDYS